VTTEQADVCTTSAGVHRLLVAAIPPRRDAALAAWVSDALGRGEKVLHKHAPNEDAHAVLRRSLASAGADPGLVTSGRVELLDTARVQAELRRGTLFDLHLEQARRAARDGFTGLAISTDAGALTRQTDDDGVLSVHEDHLGRLLDEPGVRVRLLCSYPPRLGATTFDHMLRSHHREVEDDLWSAVMSGDRLLISGEIDVSNADRFACVLEAAVDDGLRVLDVSGLRFCALAGARALATAAATLHRRGERLVLADADAGLRQLLSITGILDEPGLLIADPTEQA